MKELKSSENYTAKRVEVISHELENLLWDKGLLGDKYPQQLVDTVVRFLFCFA